MDALARWGGCRAGRGRSVAILTAVLMVGSVALAAVGAAPAEAVEPPPTRLELARGMAPTAVVTGPDGSIWFASGNLAIGRMTPAGAITMFSGPDIHYVLDLVWGADGNLWFVDNSPALGTAIVRMTPDGSTFTRFVPSLAPEDITAGPDGNLWFTSRIGNAIGRITTAGVITMSSDATVKQPEDIAAGPDGNLWFTNNTAPSVGRITPAGVISSFAFAGIGRPGNIAAGPDGNVWFTPDRWAPSSLELSRVTPAGAITTFAIGSHGNDVVAGPDGNLWVAAEGAVVKVSTAGAVLATYPSTEDPEEITLGSDGNLWFTNQATRTVSRVTTAGVLTTFRGNGLLQPSSVVVASDDSTWWINDHFTSRSLGRRDPAGVVTDQDSAQIGEPTDLTAGASGSVWLTDEGADAVRRVSAAGVVTTFTDPSIDGPTAIATGPDQTVWFLNTGTPSIGHIAANGTVTAYLPPFGEIDDPYDLAVDSTGEVWFSNLGGLDGSLVSMHPAVGWTVHWDVRRPLKVTIGPDDTVWYGRADQANSLTMTRVGRVTPDGTAPFPLALPNPVFRAGLAIGADGGLWYAGDGVIGRVSATDPDTVVTFSSPLLMGPINLARAADGTFRYVDERTAALGTITLSGAPSAALHVVGAPHSGSIAVSWQAPVHAGASPITSYVVSTADGHSCTWTAGPLTCTLTGLADGDLYAIKVTAVNAQGSGPDTSWTSVYAGEPAPLSGQVLDSFTWSGVPGAVVSVYPASGTGRLAAATTAANGYYSFPSLAPGTYRLRFSDPSGTHVSEWHSNVATAAAATPVVVTAGPDTHLAAYLDPAGRIQGRVRDRHDTSTLAGVTATLYKVSGGVQAVSTTTAGGWFDFAAVPLGTYKIKLAKPGYFTEWYQDAFLGADAMTFTVSSATAVVLDGASGQAYLTRLAEPEIAGVVTDQVSGLPMAGATVRLYTSSGQVASTATDGTGAYAFGGLAKHVPYTVRFSAAGHLTEWWNDRPAGSATTITYTGGPRFTATDAALAPG